MPIRRRGITIAALAARLPKPLSALAIRFDRRPIGNVEALTEFVRTRASYVAQTSLYGYLKTRMGTKYRDYFEDDVFSVSIRMAAVHLFVSCLGDLTIYAVAVAARNARLTPPEAAALAGYCFKHGMEQALANLPSELIPAGAAGEFRIRSATTRWDDAAEGAVAFACSERDIVRFAPVVDEYKALDGEIVANSIRFRWRDIREQLRKRLDSQGICGDWRNLST